MGASQKRSTTPRGPSPASSRGEAQVGKNGLLTRSNAPCTRNLLGLRPASAYPVAVSLKIDQDHSRFRNIVRGRIRQNLRKYVSQGELMGKQGKDVVSIPVPQIDIPRFRFADKQRGGVAQGDGNSGDPVS